MDELGKFLFIAITLVLLPAILTFRVLREAARTLFVVCEILGIYVKGVGSDTLHTLAAKKSAALIHHIRKLMAKGERDIKASEKSLVVSRERHQERLAVLHERRRRRNTGG